MKAVTRRLHAPGLRAAAAALCLLVACDAALACRCTEPAPPAAYRGADAVVTARVLQVWGDPEGPGGAVAQLALDRSWKVTLTGTIEVATSSTCAYPFEVGQELLVYLHRAKGATQWTTGRCHGNRALATAAPALTWLGRHGRTAASEPAR